MRIVVFGLPYSPNVGDGVIADCLSHGLRPLCPEAGVTVIDLSGRSGWGSVTVRNRGLALRVLKALPRAMRGSLVEARLGRLLERVAPTWRSALDGADLAIVGGGQLFSDADLNFPVKIARAAGLAAEAEVPVAVHAVGVAQNWSARGTDLFAQVGQADLRRVAVRDAPSAQAWTNQMGGKGPSPEVARDPGLSAAECYGGAAGGPAIGVCITDPTILAYHAERSVAGGGLAFWEDVVVRITEAGHVARLFCSGAVEDRNALAQLARQPRVQSLIAAGQVSVAPVPETSTALGTEVATHRAVVAHRLHACILAYAFGRPAIGLGWDKKVESFFESVNLSQNFVDGKRATGRVVVERLEAALAAGIDPATHRAVIDDTWAGIAATLSAAGITTRRST